MPDVEMRKILVVDDEVELCHLVGEILRPLGIEIHFAYNGKSALERIKDCTYDLAVSDISMPGMTGVELMRNCMSLGIPVPFLFVTAHTEKEYLLEAMRLGANDYVEKPFENEQLFETVARLLEVGARQRRIQRTIEGLDPAVSIPIIREKKMIDRFRIFNIFKRKQA